MMQGERNAAYWGCAPSMQFCTTVTLDADVHAAATLVANGAVESNGTVSFGR